MLYLILLNNNNAYYNQNWSHYDMSGTEWQCLCFEQTYTTAHAQFSLSLSLALPYTLLSRLFTFPRWNIKKIIVHWLIASDSMVSTALSFHLHNDIILIHISVYCVIYKVFLSNFCSVTVTLLAQDRECGGNAGSVIVWAPAMNIISESPTYRFYH